VSDDAETAFEKLGPSWKSPDDTREKWRDVVRVAGAAAPSDVIKAATTAALYERRDGFLAGFAAGRVETRAVLMYQPSHYSQEKALDALGAALEREKP
jgi:hypothetical protein